MATLTFDILKFANKLKAAGVPDKQAEAEAAALSEVLEVNLKELVTKEDLRIGLRELESKLEAKIDKLEAKFTGEFTLVKWMLGLLLGGIVALILRAFFPA